eukprot:scaffold3273_cov148-Cylindrotheca_fusiformis.AAC.10
MGNARIMTGYTGHGSKAEDRGCHEVGISEDHQTQSASISPFRGSSDPVREHLTFLCNDDDG